MSPQRSKTERNRRKKENAKKRKADAKSKETEEKELLEKLKKDVAPVFEVRESPGKGLGMFATCNISKGTEILREAPIFLPSCPQDWLSIEASYAVLSEDKKRRVMALHAHCFCKRSPCVETPVMKIWDANSFSAEDDSSVYIYETASRINHSCTANTTRGFTQDTYSQIVFRASQDIKQGEEIYADYIGAFGTAAFRQQICSSKFGFNCQCRACLTNTTIGFDLEKLKPNFDQASNDDVKVLGKLNQQEISAALEVEDWLNEWQLYLSETEDDFMRALINNWKQGLSTAERRRELLSGVLAEIQCVLKKHDTFGLGDDVLRKCVTRMTPEIYARAIRPLEIFIKANPDIGVLGDNDLC